jgi:hypothetical protein
MNNVKIKNLLNDYQELHSEFQINNFIIGNQGDKWAQYKQCLREIKARYVSVESDKAQLGILKTRPKQRRLFWPSKINIAKRKLEENSWQKQIQSLCDAIGERERELDCFLKQALRLKEKIGEITDERRQQLELESWTDKGRRMVAIDQILMGRPSHQTFEFVLSLPVESQNSILDKILPNNADTKPLIESLKDEVKK